jgi:hypothetical protein
MTISDVYNLTRCNDYTYVQKMCVCYRQRVVLVIY